MSAIRQPSATGEGPWRSLIRRAKSLAGEASMSGSYFGPVDEGFNAGIGAVGFLGASGWLYPPTVIVPAHGYGHQGSALFDFAGAFR